MATHQCHASVTRYHGSWPDHGRCERNGKVDLGGVSLCSQHAKEARTKGRISVVDLDRKREVYGMPSRQLAVEQDEMLVAEQKRKWAQQERDSHAKDDWRHVRKWKLIAHLVFEQSVSPDEFEALTTAHVDDVAGVIASIRSVDVALDEGDPMRALTEGTAV